MHFISKTKTILRSLIRTTRCYQYGKHTRQMCLSYCSIFFTNKQAQEEKIFRLYDSDNKYRKNSSQKSKNILAVVVLQSRKKRNKV